MEHEQDIERRETPWAEIRKVLTGVVLPLAVVAGVICLINFMFYRNVTAWRCPPTQVSSLAEVPYVGRSLSTWQTLGPVYYRYRPGFGQGYFVVVAGVTSPEAIAAFRAGGSDVADWHGTHAERITGAIKALSSVPGFAFRRSEENLSFSWDGAHVFVAASFDPQSGWFVAEVTR